jgi:hypothetical protein
VWCRFLNFIPWQQICASVTFVGTTYRRRASTVGMCSLQQRNARAFSTVPSCQRRLAVRVRAEAVTIPDGFKKVNKKMGCCSRFR